MTRRAAGERAPAGELAQDPLSSADQLGWGDRLLRNTDANLSKLKPNLTIINECQIGIDCFTKPVDKHLKYVLQYFIFNIFLGHEILTIWRTMFYFQNLYQEHLNKTLNNVYSKHLAPIFRLNGLWIRVMVKNQYEIYLS